MLVEATTDRLHAVVTTAPVRQRRGRWWWLRDAPAWRPQPRPLKASPPAALVAVAVALAFLVVLDPLKPGAPEVQLPPLGASQGTSPAATLEASPSEGPTVVPRGRTITVGELGHADKTSLGAALAIAADGDTILVRPGTYREHVVIRRDVTIAGDGPRDTVIIEPLSDTYRDADGQTRQAGVFLLGSDATLRDLTIRATEQTDAPAIVVIGGEPRLMRLLVIRETGRRPGLVVRGGTTAVISDSEFRSLVRIEEGASPTLRDSALSAGLVIQDPGTSPAIEGNVIRATGDAVDIASDTSPLLLGNDIQADSGASSEGVGVRVRSSEAVLRGNTLHDSGVAALVDRAGPLLEDNVIVGNGTGVRVPCAAPNLVGNRIEANATGIEIGDVCTINAPGEAPIRLQLQGNTICDNGRDLVGLDAAEHREANEICDDEVVSTAGAPSPSVDTDPSGSGFVLEAVSPGVEVLVDDGAGHGDPGTAGLQGTLFGLAAAPDGSVWLQSHGSDQLIQLGVPGTLQHPIGPGTVGLVFGPDGRMWVRNGELAVRGEAGWATFARRSWTSADGSPRWSVPRALAFYPDGRVIVAWRTEAGIDFWRLSPDLEDSTPFADSLPTLDGPWSVEEMVVTADGWVWLIELRISADGEAWKREPSRLLRSRGGPWEEVRPLGDIADAEPVGLSLDPAGRLVVQLRESIGGGRGIRNPFEPASYGDRTWITRRDEAGSWAITPSGEDTFPRDGYLVASTALGAWIVQPSDDGCHGLRETRASGGRGYLDGVCVSDAVVAADGRLWVVGRAHRAASQAETQHIYVITPAP